MSITNERLIRPNRPTFEELIAASKPLLDILYKYYSPNAYIMVSESHVEVLEGTMVAPLPLRD